MIDVHTSAVARRLLPVPRGEATAPDFLTKLAAQKPKIYPSGLPMAQALTSGEIAARLVRAVLVDEKAQGRTGRLRTARQGVGRAVQHRDPEDGSRIPTRPRCWPTS